MTRKTLRNFVLAVAAVLSIGSVAEAAAAKKPVHHRPRHSARVAPSATHKRKTTAAKTSKARAAKSRPQTHRAAAKRRPATKPR